jgi:Fe-S-cluster-containing hydrogenase component 2/CRP-like cAMP-binding protein
LILALANSAKLVGNNFGTKSRAAIMALKEKVYSSFEACDNEILPYDFNLFAQIARLASLRTEAKKTIGQFVGAMRLRRFRQGDPICRQGDEDCTAFYILTGADIEALRSYPQKRAEQVTVEIAGAEKKIKELEAAADKARSEGKAKDADKVDNLVKDLSDKKTAWQRELVDLPGLVEKLKTLPPPVDGPQNADTRKAALVFLGGGPTVPPSEGWLKRLTRKVTGASQPAADRPTISIPFDGPTDISLGTRQAVLNEGELFGEMACMNRAPRSATVVAARECYILEMLSNIFQEIDDDPGYRKERDHVYKERALGLQLRDLSLLRDLTDPEFTAVAAEIRNTLDLIRCKAGVLICDEHERSDYVYLVRSGLVQVKKNVSSLLSVADVTSWSSLGTLLRGGPVLRRLLPAETHAILERTPDLERATPDERGEIVHGLNAVLKNRQLAAAPEVQEISLHARLHERVRSAMSFQKSRVVDRKLEEVIKSATPRESREQASAKLEEWSELDYRRLNRLLLEEMLPKWVRPLPAASGPDAILTYCSRGDFIGEIGVCRRQPRSSTCIAFGQPNAEDEVQVELVRIPGAVFLSLMERFPAIRARVEAEIPRRDRRDEVFLQKNRAGVAAAPYTRESDRLGLIEGQRLMLIDMERCTMCGECVRGCVDAHTDGRSRLFLVGQRFDKYMVPMTCRSCLDPVCMIDCPVRSIQRGDNHEMVIKDWCIGCQKCARNCPYDAIKMHDVPRPAADSGGPYRIRQELAVVCDLCSSLADQTPRCVYACPHEAAMRINAPLELPKLSPS